MKKIYIIIALCLIVIIARSQSTTILDNGFNGFGANISTIQGSNNIGANYNIGFTYQGIIDLNAAYTHKSFDKFNEILFENDARSITKSINISYWFLSSDFPPGINFRLGVTSGIEFSKFSDYIYVNEGNSHLVHLENSIRGNIGLNTLMNIQIKNNWKIQSSFYYYYLLGRDELVELNINNDDSYNLFKTSFGINLAKEFSEGYHFYVSMNQVFFTNYNENYFQLGAGFIIPLGK